MKHEWPLTEMRNLPWHALQRTLASEFASQLAKKGPLTPRSAEPEQMSSWLVRALIDTPPIRLAQ